MSNEAELPAVRVVRVRLGWPQLRLGLCVLVALLLAILGLDELTDWLETRRLQRDQSPQAQAAEWQRVHQRGLNVAKQLKAVPLREAREVNQLLQGYWADPRPLRTPAALQRAGNDSQDLIEAGELLKQAEWADAEQARMTQVALQMDEEWRQAEHGLAPRPPRPLPAALRIAALPLPAGMSVRHVAWIHAQSALKFRQQARRATWRLVYRYDLSP